MREQWKKFSKFTSRVISCDKFSSELTVENFYLGTRARRAGVLPGDFLYLHIYIQKMKIKKYQKYQQLDMTWTHAQGARESWQVIACRTCSSAHACTHTHTHAHIHTHTYAHTHIHTHIHEHTHTHKHTHTHTHKRTLSHTHTQTHTHSKGF